MENNTFVDTLWNTMQEYIVAWNKEAARQKVNNIYKLEVLDGDKPIQANGIVYKHYKTMQLVVDTPDGSFVLYIAHSPLKDMTEGSRSKNWLLQLLKDIMYQMFTNYTIMVHSHILATEEKKKVAMKQVGNLVDMDGRPLMREVKEEVKS